MLSTKDFGQQLKDNGFSFYAGVPCSFLKDLINYAINDCDYIGCSNEGDAIAAAAGAALGGKRAVALMQNSGLTNATSPITSLLQIFNIPILMFISHRGEPGIPDEPQHQLMGRITQEMLTLMEVPWAVLSQDPAEVPKQLKEALAHMDQGKPFAFVVQKGTFGKEPLTASTPEKPVPSKRSDSGKPDEYPTRIDALKVLQSHGDKNTVLLATTGKCGRELCELGDQDNQLYMVGSMGCISSLGLGLAKAKPTKNIISIDGDGAVLMRLGNLATLGYYGQKNLLHVVLDNHTHDSTGGQETVSTHTEFSKIAEACHYPNVIMARTLNEFSDAIANWKKSPELTFIHFRIQKGSLEQLGRPGIGPAEVKHRLMAFLGA
jgi:phosphonopyruvate decarboxylase